MNNPLELMIYKSVYKTKLVKNVNNLIWIICVPYITLLNYILSFIQMTDKDQDNRKDDPCYERSCIIIFVIPILVVLSVIFGFIFVPLILVRMCLQIEKRRYDFEVVYSSNVTNVIESSNNSLPKNLVNDTYRKSLNNGSSLPYNVIFNIPPIEKICQTSNSTEIQVVWPKSRIHLFTSDLILHSECFNKMQNLSETEWRTRQISAILNKIWKDSPNQNDKDSIVHYFLLLQNITNNNSLGFLTRSVLNSSDTPLRCALIRGSQFSINTNFFCNESGLIFFSNLLPIVTKFIPFYNKRINIKSLFSQGFYATLHNLNDIHFNGRRNERLQKPDTNLSYYAIFHVQLEMNVTNETFIENCRTLENCVSQFEKSYNIVLFMIAGNIDSTGHVSFLKQRVICGFDYEDGFFLNKSENCAFYLKKSNSETEKTVLEIGFSKFYDC
ncbi:hypothetical protein A3Q56_01557 [Intoshia linei]|uniref:Uncharacterized protein n=1 Tax=Intoshia linei TaxID=1819745 RepID=A0A177BAZ5_9BILA|nr:hypothetical protein A3Q56_01557 [Intoshia linei]